MPIQFTEQDELNASTNLPRKKQGAGIAITEEENALDRPTQISSPLFFDTVDFTDTYTDDLYKYTDYGVVPTRFTDWNETRAQNQGTGEKWMRGLAKAGITTLGAVAENTVGILTGLGSVLTGGQYYDNAVGRTVDKANEWARSQMPNYYTKREEEMGAFQRLGTANFWADKAMNGLGYSLGSIATMALTGGAGYLGMAGRAMGASRMATLGDKAAKIHKLYKTTKSAATAGKLTDMMGKVSAAQRFQRAGQMLDAGIMMSLAESSVEARETKKHTYDTLVENALEQKGLEYEWQLGEEKLKTFRDASNAAGNVNFGLNMAVLSASNAYIFGKMMSPKYVQRSGALRGIKKNQAGEWADNTAKGWRKGYKRVKPVLQGSAAEGIQEGSQYASNIGTTEFYTSKFSDMGGISRVEALNEGLSRTFGETEGIESILLGIITGGIMGGGTSLVNKPMKARDAAAQQVLDILNTGEFLNSVDKAQGQERTLKLLEKMEEAYKNDDPGLAEQYRLQALMSDIITMDNAGLIDLYKQKLDDAVNLPDEEFAKQFGYNTEVKFDKHKVVEELKKDIDIIVKRKNAIDAMFPTRRTLGIPRLLMSEEARANEEQRIKETVILKDALLQQSVFLDKVEGYKKEAAQNIADIIPGITLSRLEKSADSAKEEYDRLIEEAILADPNATNENELPKEVRDAALQAAYKKFIDDTSNGIETKYNPADTERLSKALGKYYGLHSAEQEVFEGWNRLQTNAGRNDYIRVALMDEKNKINEESDKMVEDLIQQETDPEKIAKNVPEGASTAAKEKAKKEVQNINNIRQNIINKYMDEKVSMEEIDAAIEERKDSELRMPFENTEDKQAYIELLELRKIKKTREGQGLVNPQAEQAEQNSKDIQETVLVVDSVEKLKRVFKPVHPNEHYSHVTLSKKENLSDDYLSRFPIGKEKKVKIIGRYKSDRMDVILIEPTMASDYSNPFIVLSLADGVTMAEVQPALFEAQKGTKIKMYKSPKYVNTTFGYMDGNGAFITDTVEESAPEAPVDSAAEVEQPVTEQPTQNLNEIEEQAEMQPGEQMQMFEEQPVDELQSEEYDSFVEDDVIILDDEFVPDDVKKAELQAFNVEQKKQTNELVEEPSQSLGEIMSQEDIVAEEEALRKEMEELKKNLNKEDDNCAT